jgi:transglutaminase-like cysteine proteinase BTLCP
MGRYVSQPLTIQCHSIEDIREFLCGCRAVSDKELFGRDEYWQPPEEFEKRKAGDCEDFALWTWRQLLSMGYEARFIGGSCGRYGEGHAWVEYFQDGNCFLVESLRCRIGDTMPRLSTLRYEPKLSVSWDGKILKYFAHKKPESRLGWRVLVPLVCEYLVFWSWFWLRNFYRVPQFAWRILRRRLFRRELWLQRRNRER